VTGEEAMADSPQILVIDDEEAVRRLLALILDYAGYQVTTASNASEAKDVLSEGDFALVVSDVGMPGESGVQLLDYVRSEYPDTATILVTGRDDPDVAAEALRAGCYGYVIKPFHRNQVLIDVMNALRRRDLELENRQHRESLEDIVKERTSDLWLALGEVERSRRQIESAQAETIARLSLAAEFRDDETARHLERMSLYCSVLADRIGLGTVRRQLIRLASIMHDVGKIGIPDRILLKPGPLDEDEMSQMRRHAEIGHQILEGSDSELLQTAAEIALTHHEWFDGSGYPNHAAADDIPIEGRIAAIADVFDALTNDRVYRKAFPLNVAVKTMREGRETHFDPDLLDVFFDGMDEVMRIMSATEDRSYPRLHTVA
jgi:putative two-component system response regulator